ncbi:MAG: dimethyl sulfoxide reductase anchor subunit [Coriobacteriales bacterium]|jgi:anaerobic dimethyl sulfoxide reductase subunit C (anchor subunit)|nr:dimethyl sulfoxide reductase anchor subunit [Coriobacteriales bacterium]
MEIQWSLVLFTLFVCLSAGVFAGQGLLVLLGKGAKLQMPSLMVALVALLIGGIASFTHLQHWERSFNGFGHLSSGITQELIAVAVMFVLIIIYFAFARRGEIPKWMGALAVVGGVVLVLVMANSYMMAARPVWSTVLLHLFYLAQMVVAGASALWLIAALTKTEDSLQLGARFTAVGGALVAVSLVAYAAYVGSLSLPMVGNYFDPTEPTKPMVAPTDLGSNLLVGELAAYFWGALIMGGVIAAVLGFLFWNKSVANSGFAGAALICALAGGIAFRAALYILGISVYAFY